MKKIIVLLLAGVLLFAAGCSAAQPASQGPKIEVQQPWARAMAAMQMDMSQATPGAMQGSDMGHGGGFNSAAYMLLKNTGGAADRLVAAKGDVAESIEIHESTMKDGVMSMHPVEAIELPAGGQAELKPGGYHVMLINLKRDLVAGEKFTLTLVFEKSGEQQIEVEVRAP